VARRMAIVDTVLPILLILGLGAVLARLGFLGQRFVEDLNGLVYWIGIPCLVVHALAVASAPAAPAFVTAGALLATTLAAVLAGLAVARLLRLPRRGVGTFLQASFRGNLAFVGLPVLLYSSPERPEAVLAFAVLVMTPVVVAHNLLAVTVLLASTERLDRKGLRTIGREALRNPLILACLAGALASASPVALPTALLRALGAVGEIAIPLALLCVGAALARAKLAGRTVPALVATLLKVALIPALALLAGRLLALDADAYRVLVVFAACPTAATSNILAARLGGDETLASATIAVSTVLSVLTLSAAVALLG
jgi:predicted permease